MIAHSEHEAAALRALPGERLVEAVAGLALERVDYGWVAG